MTNPTQEHGLLLEQLSNAFGPSGDEGDVRKLIVEAIQPYVANVQIDTLGNALAQKPGAGHSLKVMLDAHMDEVGFMVTHIEENGLLRFGMVGTLDPRMLPGKTVAVGHSRVPGVIGLKPIHLSTADELTSVAGIQNLAIDIGAKDGDQARQRVSVGDYVVFHTCFSHLGGSSADPRTGRVKGKAFDDRVGCAVLVEVLKGDYPVDVVGAFTVQEEVGMRGAHVAAFAAEPDLAVVLEGTVADDLPDQGSSPPSTRLGHGPAITLMDRSFVADRRLVDWLIESAEPGGSPHQFKRPNVGSTDGGAINRSRIGVPTVALSVPCRYIHAPVAVMDLSDFWHTVDLLKAALMRLPSAWRTGDGNR
jgi:putative aminopeptidase FrvX